MEPKLIDPLRQRIQEATNLHGYALQDAFVRKASELFEGRRSRWRLANWELPVRVNQKESRIDVVLQYQPGNHPAFSDPGGLYLAIECKRVNKALSEWCFFRSSIPSDSINFRDDFFLHSIQRVPPSFSAVRVALKRTDSQVPIYNCGVVVKTRHPGDSSNSPSDRDAIEQACSQAIIGANGFIELLRENPTFLGGKGAGVIPVVFTTADIFTSARGFGTANLEDGKVDLTGDEISTQGWVIIHYQVSPALRTNMEVWTPHSRDSESLSDLQFRSYTRSVAIVNPSGLEDFLAWKNWDYFSQLAGDVRL